ncbi:MAG: hypothetical protein ABIF12_01790 [bacterium]
MLNQRVNIILEQTGFLSEKQNELFQFVTNTYKDILNSLNDKINQSSEESVLNDLNAIKDRISKHHSELSSQMKDDVDFLNEQLKAITQIKDLEDKDKAEELLSMIIAQDEELLETDQFKKQIEEDITESMRELQVMHEDLLNSLKENKIQELRLMLETVENETDQDQGCDTDDCSSCHGCSVDNSTNVFDFFKEESKKENDDK